MLNFLKVILRNVSKGPATDDFPYRPAPTPQRFRGKVELHPNLCLGCEICKHVCMGDAIRIDKREDNEGYDFTIWHNTCCLCGNCTHFCPTKAITLSTDWHNAHEQSEKYGWAEHHFVPYLRCEGCGAPIRMLPPELATRLYAHSPVDMTELLKLCPNCRQIATVEREGGMQHEHVAEAGQQG